MTTRAIRLPLLKRQAGASLVIGLIILTVLTVLGLVSTSGHLLQQKALAAGIEREQALNAAERALEWGESLLDYSSGPACQTGCSSVSRTWDSQALPSAIESMDDAWWQASGMEFGQDPLQQATGQPWLEASQPPRVVIAQLHRQDHTGTAGEAYEYRYYQVFANGYSANENNHVLVSSTVAVPFPLNAGNGESANEAAAACPDTGVRCGRVGWRELN